MNPRDLAQNPHLRNLSPAALASAEAFEAARARLELAYFSKVRFVATLSGSTYTVTPAENRAFGFGLRTSMEPAGFASGTLATPADTNLQRAGETNFGADLYVRGMSVQPIKGDAALVKALRADVSTKIVIGSGDDAGFFLGPLGSIAGGAGLTGAEIAASTGVSESALAHGQQYADNVFSFGRRPLHWAPVGSNNPDNNLAIVFKTERAISFATTIAETSPATLEAVYLVKLYCDISQQLSKNY